MRYAGHFVRKAILSKLVGNINIGDGVLPIYGRVPDNATYPYALVRTEETSEIDQNQSTFISQVNTAIEIVTRYASDDGSALKAQQYANSILQVIRTRSANYMDLSNDGFKVYVQELSGITNIEEPYSDFYYYRTIINLNVRLQELPEWILLNGIWNDSGIWFDTNVWID